MQKFINSLMIMLCLLCGLVTCLPLLGELHQASLPQLMEESGLHLRTAEDFTFVSAKENDVMPFEAAVKHQSERLEIRYIIRPLSRITIDYEDPHNAAPEPNHLFPMLFEAMTNALSGSGNTPNNSYSPEDAKQMFNADWAAASVFDVNPDFSTHYSQGLMIAIHKDNQADAYSVFLFNDYPEVKHLIDSNLTNLSFNPPQ